MLHCINVQRCSHNKQHALEWQCNQPHLPISCKKEYGENHLQYLQFMFTRGQTRLKNKNLLWLPIRALKKPVSSMSILGVWVWFIYNCVCMWGVVIVYNVVTLNSSWELLLSITLHLQKICILFFVCAMCHIYAVVSSLGIMCKLELQIWSWRALFSGQRLLD